MMKVWPLALGMGIAAGAVTAMMLPRQSTARKLVTQAADKVETTANQLSNKVLDEVTG